MDEILFVNLMNTISRKKWRPVGESRHKYYFQKKENTRLLVSRKMRPASFFPDFLMGDDASEKVFKTE